MPQLAYTTSIDALWRGHGCMRSCARLSLLRQHDCWYRSAAVRCMHRGTGLKDLHVTTQPYDGLAFSASKRPAQDDWFIPCSFRAQAEQAGTTTGPARTLNAGQPDSFDARIQICGYTCCCCSSSSCCRCSAVCMKSSASSFVTTLILHRGNCMITPHVQPRAGIAYARRRQGPFSKRHDLIRQQLSQQEYVGPGDAMAVRDAIDLVCLLNDLRMEGGHDELAGVPLIGRLRSRTAHHLEFRAAPRSVYRAEHIQRSLRHDTRMAARGILSTSDCTQQRLSPHGNLVTSCSGRQQGLRSFSSCDGSAPAAPACGRRWCGTAGPARRRSRRRGRMPPGRSAGWPGSAPAPPASSARRSAASSSSPRSPRRTPAVRACRASRLPAFSGAAMHSVTTMPLPRCSYAQLHRITARPELFEVLLSGAKPSSQC